MFRVNDGENPKSSNPIKEPIAIKMDHTPIVSEGNNRKMIGNSKMPDPICRKVAK